MSDILHEILTVKREEVAAAGNDIDPPQPGKDCLWKSCGKAYKSYPNVVIFIGP